MVLFSNTCRNVASHRLHTQKSVKGDAIAPKRERKGREMLACVIITNISKHFGGHPVHVKHFIAVSFNPESKVGS